MFVTETLLLIHFLQMLPTSSTYRSSENIAVFNSIEKTFTSVYIDFLYLLCMILNFRHYCSQSFGTKLLQIREQ